MKLGYLLALFFLLAGVCGISLSLATMDDSTFGKVVVIGACTIPIAGAFFHRTRSPLSSRDWLQKEIKFTNTGKVDKKS